MTYIPGDHWLICDECGLKFRRSQVIKRWDGAIVCKKDYEPRHPQESVRAKSDSSKPDFVRTENVTYITTPVTVDDL